MKAFATVAAVAFSLALSATTIADAQTTLPPINVTANPCDYGINCTYAPGFNAFLVPMAPALPPDVASIGPEDDPLVATCKSLRDRASRMGCDVNNPPPAPSFPSPTQGQWQSNGCGDGTITTNLLATLLGSQIDGYTGDRTNPLPGVSFASPCAGHDKCYYTSGFKTICDGVFAHALDQASHEQATGTRFAQCLAFAGAYSTAVDQHGQDAYSDDQRTMECAKISSDLDHGNCVTS